ncbi:glycosyltransferase WbuB [Qipengyuania flava]|uniref:Glycosyltransferase WbuB n=1 Tax=Qipengyuania flava TaxID=192812 RepID=A0A5P6NDA1_9SPHN|nr:glycosyltransferase family 4 protein [Qipengyuania flava]QFI63987.1 glycosyltransferase WbuB [Qipengyuania flava]
MKLLILSNYFTPDLSAGSFRIQALIDALQPMADAGLEVDLITTSPNRYASMSAEALPFENHGWLKIHRIKLSGHNSGMFDQAWSYVRYAVGVCNLTGRGKWDAVFATSSRLMTAGLGSMIARRLKVPLYLDIRDLFTDNIEELLVGSPIKALLPVFKRIERQSLQRASRVNVVSQGFVEHVRSRAPAAALRVHTNGIDDLFLDTDFRMSKLSGQQPLILYAGNMGEGQGLDRIVPQAAKALKGKARFRLIGDGGRRDDLEASIKAEGLDYVELLSPVPRQDLLEHYREADILFMHLNDLNAFRKVLPSKLFEYGAIQKPILAGVAGYAAEFMAEHLPDAAVFDPLDASAMVEAADRLIAYPPDTSRPVFRTKFARSEIMARLATDVLGMIEEHLGISEYK